MKTLKITFVALMALGLSIATVNAQDAGKAKATKQTTAKKTDAGAKTNATGQHLKKDGTPDMRYKENKQAAASKSTSTKASSGNSTPGAAGKGKTTKATKSTK